MTIQIRVAKQSDVAGIFNVRTSVSENVLSLTELSNMGITEASITGMIMSDQCAWVAVEDGNIIGFSMIDADEGSLFAAFVLPSHEGRGVGRRLVEAAEKELFTRHEVCWLETGSTTRAAGFYRRLGWANEQDIGNEDIRLEKRRA